MYHILAKINVMRECKRSELDLYQCPPFLFILMGIINVVAMVASYALTQHYTDEPAVAVGVVTAVSVLILIIGNFVISGFNKIAEANQLKSEFISVVSHQLRSPLSVFKWTTDILIKETRDGKGHADETYLAILKENTEQMIQLVNLLLEANRVESHRMILNPVPFSIEKMTKEIVDATSWYSSAYNVRIEFSCAPELASVIADPERTRMVIQNLMDNAIRYSNHSGVIKILLLREGDFVRWSIRDDGVGIPPEQQKFIFQKFFRSDNAIKHQTEGSGLGLYIARAIVEASGGAIGFDSELDKGSTFWFTLPTKPMAGDYKK